MCDSCNNCKHLSSMAQNHQIFNKNTLVQNSCFPPNWILHNTGNTYVPHKHYTNFGNQAQINKNIGHRNSNAQNGHSNGYYYPCNGNPQFQSRNNNGQYFTQNVKTSRATQWSFSSIYHGYQGPNSPNGGLYPQNNRQPYFNIPDTRTRGGRPKCQLCGRNGPSAAACGDCSLRRQHPKRNGERRGRPWCHSSGIIGQ
ncbi:hypothetical protein HHI36_016740 [Cryptolaemus montrouzieri]|uniref:GATA zinc finger domain-containing protein 14-like n=1 Tax=Cryptolaemus montrouzieri TaxID=559131 RepID=A0ABD2NLD7_9CUCU